ncbi:MAG: hypothetical protein AB7F31_01685 [Parachlamydiales bacterium]
MEDTLITSKYFSATETGEANFQAFKEGARTLPPFVPYQPDQTLINAANQRASLFTRAGWLTIAIGAAALFIPNRARLAGLLALPVAGGFFVASHQKKSWIKSEQDKAIVKDQSAELSKIYEEMAGYLTERQKSLEAEIVGEFNKRMMDAKAGDWGDRIAIRKEIKETSLQEHQKQLAPRLVKMIENEDTNTGWNFLIYSCAWRAEAEGQALSNVYQEKMKELMEDLEAIPAPVSEASPAEQQFGALSHASNGSLPTFGTPEAVKSAFGGRIEAFTDMSSEKWQLRAVEVESAE